MKRSLGLRAAILVVLGLAVPCLIGFIIYTGFQQVDRFEAAARKGDVATVNKLMD